MRMGAKLLLCAAGGLALIAAAPLNYDPAVFRAGECLSGAGGSCAAPERVGASASEALLEAGNAPRLAVDFGGMLELGPEVTGGGSAVLD